MITSATILTQLVACGRVGDAATQPFLAGITTLADGSDRITHTALLPPDDDSAETAGVAFAAAIMAAEGCGRIVWATTAVTDPTPTDPVGYPVLMFVEADAVRVDAHDVRLRIGDTGTRTADAATWRRRNDAHEFHTLTTSWKMAHRYDLAELPAALTALGATLIRRDPT